MKGDLQYGEKCQKQTVHSELDRHADFICHPGGQFDFADFVCDFCKILGQTQLCHCGHHPDGGVFCAHLRRVYGVSRLFLAHGRDHASVQYARPDAIGERVSRNYRNQYSSRIH